MRMIDCLVSQAPLRFTLNAMSILKTERRLATITRSLPTHTSTQTFSRTTSTTAKFASESKRLKFTKLFEDVDHRDETSSISFTNINERSENF